MSVTDLMTKPSVVLNITENKARGLIVIDLMEGCARTEGKPYISWTISMGGVEKRFWSRMVPARGLGRWFYCKYCDRTVRPWLGSVNQIVCPECGYGLTPDFHTFQELREYLKELREEADA